MFANADPICAKDTQEKLYLCSTKLISNV